MCFVAFQKHGRYRGTHSYVSEREPKKTVKDGENLTRRSFVYKNFCFSYVLYAGREKEIFCYFLSSAKESNAKKRRKKGDTPFLISPAVSTPLTQSVLRGLTFLSFVLFCPKSTGQKRVRREDFVSKESFSGRYTILGSKGDALCRAGDTKGGALSGVAPLWQLSLVRFCS